MKRSLKILCAVLCLCVALLPVTAFADIITVASSSVADGGRLPFGVAASSSASESASASASSSAAAADTAADPNPETGSSDVIGLVGSLAIVALLGSAIACRKK